MKGRLRIHYQIIDKENLLIQKFSGQFSFEVYSKYTLHLMNENDLSTITRVLIDFRELTIGTNLSSIKQQIKKVADFRKTIQQKEIRRNDIKQIFWVENPIPTAIAKIFVNNFPHLNYQICSSLPSVLKQLTLSADDFDLESITAKLKNEFISE